MNTYPKRIEPRALVQTEFRFQPRHGVTLMEVIFAIGIVLTGLVGLAALIPIAASNAKAALELDRGVSESTSSAAMGLVRSFNDPDSLVIIDKEAAGSPSRVLPLPYGYSPSGALQAISSKLNFAPIEKLETPGYGHMPFGSGLSSGICIDPLGIPDPNYVSPGASVSTNDSAFDYSRFPYYGERYRVLAPPNDAINSSPGNPGPPSGSTPVWPMSPRMWRATLKSPLYTTSIPVRRHQLIPAMAVRRIFEGSGGLSPIEGAKKDDPRSVLVSRTQVGGSYVDSGRDTSSDYSWFATLVPPFLGGNTFRQSIVVVRQRLSPVPTRANDSLALQKNNYPVKDADDNPAAERLTWINPAEVVGFNGGAGGEVKIYGSNLIKDNIQVGQWVMLSRQPHLLAPTLTPTGPAVHRWFRVLRVDDPQYIDAYNWPGGTHDVWRRGVALAGPDWAFEDGATSPVDDTFCTIVTDVVSVIESDVVLQ